MYTCITARYVCSIHYQLLWLRWIVKRTSNNHDNHDNGPQMCHQHFSFWLAHQNTCSWRILRSVDARVYTHVNANTVDTHCRHMPTIFSTWHTFVIHNVSLWLQMTLLPFPVVKVSKQKWRVESGVWVLSEGGRVYTVMEMWPGDAHYQITVCTCAPCMYMYTR